MALASKRWQNSGLHARGVEDIPCKVTSYGAWFGPSLPNGERDFGKPPKNRGCSIGVVDQEGRRFVLHLTNLELDQIVNSNDRYNKEYGKDS